MAIDNTDFQSYMEATHKLVAEEYHGENKVRMRIMIYITGSRFSLDQRVFFKICSKTRDLSERRDIC